MSRLEESLAATTLDSIGYPIYGFDRRWRYTFLNRAARDYLNKGRDEVIGQLVWEVVPGIVGTSFETAYRSAMDSTEPSVWEDYYAPVNRWFRANFFPNSEGLIIQSMDVTDFRVGQQQISKSVSHNSSESEMHWAFDLMPDPVMTIDDYDRFTYCNTPALHTNHRKLEDVLGRPFWEVNPLLKGSALVKYCARARKTGKRERFELQLIPPGWWFRVELIPVSGGIIIYAVDISKQKNSEASVDVLTSALEEALDLSWNRKDLREV